MKRLRVWHVRISKNDCMFYCTARIAPVAPIQYCECGNGNANTTVLKERNSQRRAIQKE